MMGAKQVEQNALFYEFSVEGHVPADHLLRSVDRFVDLGELRGHLALFYSETGRPSVGPELMIRMLLIGYCLGIRSVVNAQKPESPRTPSDRIWQVPNGWNSTTESLFSAWIEKLFDAPPDQDLSWKVWHEVLRGAGDDRCDYQPQRAGEDARHLGREWTKISGQAGCSYGEAKRRVDLPDQRRMGRLFYAGARFPSFDRDRCRSEFP
jgi:hypothetical protein